VGQAQLFNISTRVLVAALDSTRIQCENTNHTGMTNIYLLHRPPTFNSPDTHVRVEQLHLSQPAQERDGANAFPVSELVGHAQLFQSST
jgi:hypothetical protein